MERKEMWLPTAVTKVTVVDGVVKVWDEMTMALRAVKEPAGFVKPSAPPDDPSYKSR